MMRRIQNKVTTDYGWAWRFFLIAGLSLLMCSCKSLRPSAPPQSGQWNQPVAESDQNTERQIDAARSLPAGSPQPSVGVSDDAAPRDGGPTAPPTNYPSTNYPPTASTPPTISNPPAAAAGTYPTAQPPRYPVRQVDHRTCLTCRDSNPYPALPTQGPGSCSCCNNTPQGWVAPCLPQDEYLYDGGDRKGAVNVAPDWTVHGLDQEDTVVHYDTRQGRLEIQPSNRVCIYAPRFATVRRVDGALQNTKMMRLADARLGIGFARHDDITGSNTVMQQLQPGRNVATRGAIAFKERKAGKNVDNFQASGTTKRRLKAFEDFLIVRRGQYDNSEKARLAARINAAKTWTHNKGLQMVVDGFLISEAASISGPQSVSMYELPEGKSRLRVVKLASTDNAKSGEEVEFTIRFDNVGDQVVGNVTVIDNLTTRLVYVPDSQSCTVDAKFITEANDGETLVLRWEITKPLKVGKGGVIRFKCRVR